MEELQWVPGLIGGAEAGSYSWWRLPRVCLASAFTGHLPQYSFIFCLLAFYSELAHSSRSSLASLTQVVSLLDGTSPQSCANMVCPHVESLCKLKLLELSMHSV
jgi:hypothetical protein